MNDKRDDIGLVLLGENHSGRDEMNLAGNAFALLSAASRNGQSFIKYEWDRRLDSGRTVTASWKVTGDADLGLPGPNEELLYLVLLQMTREAAGDSTEWPEIVQFSRWDILQRLNWPDNPGQYKNLKDAFFRLQSVSIQAEYSFWDKASNAPYDAIGVGIIDEFRIVAEPRGKKAAGTIPLSWWRWNKTLHSSFNAGNLRSMALDFALSLDLPTSRRLFRYLDMMRDATTPPRREFEIGLFKLRDRIGMTGYKYASKIKEKLVPAVEELKQRGYLESVRYEEGVESEKIIFRFGVANLKRTDSPDEQSRVVQRSAISSTEKPPKTTAKSNAAPQQTIPDLIAEKSSDVRLDALKCHSVFKALSEEEQTELIDLAKKDVNPIWHDRLGVPESPMSLGLWQLVAARYPERCK